MYTYIYIRIHTYIFDRFPPLRYLLHHAPKLGVRTHQPGRHHLVCTWFFFVGMHIVSAGIRMCLAISMIGTHTQVSRSYARITLSLPTVCVRAPRWSLTSNFFFLLSAKKNCIKKNRHWGRTGLSGPDVHVGDCDKQGKRIKARTDNNTIYLCCMVKVSARL